MTLALINRFDAANCYMLRVMIWSWIKGGLTHAVLALAALAFILVPAADAAVCGPEPAAAVSSVHVADIDGGQVVQTEQAPDTQDGHGGEACLHGHCHHQGQVVSAPIGGVEAAWFMPTATVGLVTDRTPPGAEQPLLQRPPRV